MMKKIIIYLIINIILYIVVPESVHQYIMNKSCNLTVKLLNRDTNNCNNK